MKKLMIFGLLIAAAVAVAEDEEIPAEECDFDACKLPDCRCSSTDVPGGIRYRDIPQFVTLTFDDAVNLINIETYRRILYNRVNTNSCPIGTTFYVNHEYTNYQAVNELYGRGFEIALHSVTHLTNQTYWSGASYETLVQEFANQREQLAHFANIPINTIKGMRMPFLQMAGNAQFRMMANHGLQYDASMPTNALVNPGLWPYTLDYKTIQECIIPPCFNASIPGPWVKPILSWTDLGNVPCAFVDACFNRPDLDDEQGWYDFILKNFENHYTGNRAPFGFYVHEWFIRTNPAIERALVRFMNLINTLNDVFMVNSEAVVEWVRNPVPLEEYRRQNCRTFPGTFCLLNNCGPLRGRHNDLDYWMSICSACPRVYPWVDNHLGQ